MLHFITGNIFDTNAECLVNTVNCEGFMGKGVAYQFKMRYPRNFDYYSSACKTGNLKVGQILVVKEEDKTIINFPTKNKWREKSRMEYIITGLDTLINELPKLNVSSIALPPLGSGNGGLVWSDVRKVITEKLKTISSIYEFYIYEPSKNYQARPIEPPKLNTSSLVLMNMKLNMNKFSHLRLQKAAFFTNYFCGEEYFHFTKYKFGPYDKNINIISKNIKQYQLYYDLETKEAYKVALNQLISENVQKKLDYLLPAIIKATKVVNEINNTNFLECVSTIFYILQQKEQLNLEQITEEFVLWSSYKAEKFNKDIIKRGIEYLLNKNMIEQTMIGYATVKVRTIKDEKSLSGLQ